MRKLKDGTVKYKPSAMKEQQRLSESPQPMTLYRRFASVEVYVGSGWRAGSVQLSTSSRCSVFLFKEQRNIVCYDNRNIRPKAQV